MVKIHTLFVAKITSMKLAMAVLSSAVAIVGFTLSAPAWAQCPGCCSNHGGITQSCASNGHVMCADGTASPSCTCSSCGVSPTTRYTLSVSKAGLGSGLVNSNPSGISCGNTCAAAYNSGTFVNLSATPTSGSTFGGWSGSCSGSSGCGITMSGTRSVTATFNAPVVPIAYALTVTRAGTGSGTVTSSPSGINCGSTCGSNFTSGTRVTLTATPASGATFAGWGGACSGTGTCALDMTVARTAVATFNAAAAPITLALAVSVSGAGSVASNPTGINCGSACASNFQGGTVVALSPTPASGHQFTGWSGDCSGAGNCNILMDRARTVSASFTGPNVVGVQPETGLWWNAAEPGRGFNIEVQNNFLFFVGYLYNADGSAQWYSAQGEYSHTLRRFDGPLNSYVRGQCLICPFQRNERADSPGNLTLTFSTASSGTLTWPGGQIPITRTRLVVPEDARQLLGSWVFSSDVGANAVGDWIKFTGAQAATGTVSGTNAGDRPVMGSVQSSSLVVLVDASAGFYDLYTFPLQATGIASLGEGLYWQYPKAGSPVGPGTPAKAFKSGPAPSGAAVSDDEGPAKDMADDLHMAAGADDEQNNNGFARQL